jgi:hypothetical protein
LRDGSGAGGEWSRRSESNRRPADYESAALPTELLRLALMILSRCLRSVKQWSEAAGALNKEKEKDRAVKPIETERAARQQGSSFLRENSPNGGKAIRTFWLHSRSAGRECQAEIGGEITPFDSMVYKSFSGNCAERRFDVSSPFSILVLPSFVRVF